ncbi:MAG: hypothetical protein KF729_19985 [Sandaracinaceae bacterium]|nr:hypothetical protein [Sandaracinaceae bacterium]
MCSDPRRLRSGRSAPRAGLALFASFFLACGSEPEGPAPALRDDLTVLHAILDADPALEPLARVEQRVADERPVHAAELLETTAIPAATRQVAALEEARVTTDEGRDFQRRLVAAHRQRASALESYRAALAGGVTQDPLVVIDAVRELRRAEVALVGVVRAMDALLPAAPPAPGGPVDEPEARDRR